MKYLLRLCLFASLTSFQGKIKVRSTLASRRIWSTLHFSICSNDKGYVSSFQELRKSYVSVCLLFDFFSMAFLHVERRDLVGQTSKKRVTRLDKTCFLAREETISKPGVRWNCLANLFFSSSFHEISTNPINWLLSLAVCLISLWLCAACSRRLVGCRCIC